jgi:hypothetical protein
MNATMRLTEAEVVEACLAYVRSCGYEPQGKGDFELRGGDGKPLGVETARVAFVVAVQPKKP